jgi:hypothetical protein
MSQDRRFVRDFTSILDTQQYRPTNHAREHLNKQLEAVIHRRRFVSNRIREHFAMFIRAEHHSAYFLKTVGLVPVH